MTILDALVIQVAQNLTLHLRTISSVSYAVCVHHSPFILLTKFVGFSDFGTVFCNIPYNLKFLSLKIKS